MKITKAFTQTKIISGSDQDDVEFNINLFLEIYQINEIEEINLNYLRYYYKKDKEKALDLIDEFTLRGFTFLSEIKTSVLPNIKEKNTGKYIVVSESGNNFKNINITMDHYVIRNKDDYNRKKEQYLYNNNQRNVLLNGVFELFQLDDMYLINDNLN